MLSSLFSVALALLTTISSSRQYYAQHPLDSHLSLFLVVEPEKLLLITILDLIRFQGSGGVSEGMKTPRALVAVGQAVEIEYKSFMCKRVPVQQKCVIYIIVVICAGSDPLFVSSPAGTMRYKENQE